MPVNGNSPTTAISCTTRCSRGSTQSSERRIIDELRPVKRPPRMFGTYMQPSPSLLISLPPCCPPPESLWLRTRSGVRGMITPVVLSASHRRDPRIVVCERHRQSQRRSNDHKRILINEPRGVEGNGSADRCHDHDRSPVPLSLMSATAKGMSPCNQRRVRPVELRRWVQDTSVFLGSHQRIPIRTRRVLHAESMSS